MIQTSVAREDFVLGVYRRPDLMFTRGHGSWLYDADGRAYLDFISGVGVTSLGHAHPGLAAALSDQARAVSHTSNLFHHPVQSPAAERLLRLSGMARAFFCNSGAEAVEACLKFARRYWHTQGPPRSRFVALQHGFHGRTMGALSVTWEAHYRDPFAPLLGPVAFVAPDDARALIQAVDADTAAVILEPIQGEGGVRPLGRAFADAVTHACGETGALLITDEVQCGLGRTGVPFAGSRLGLKPHMIAVGKALGGGFPVGAALFSERVASVAQPGDHGSTYGGNPLACRAALVFLEELMDGGLLERVSTAGARLKNGLRALATRTPLIREVRGEGLMCGIEIDGDALAVVDAARGRGLLINRTSGSVLRLLPPFTIEDEEIDRGLDLLEQSLRAQEGHPC